jgi:hypothetical protein
MEQVWNNDYCNTWAASALINICFLAEFFEKYLAMLSKIPVI